MNRESFQVVTESGWVVYPDLEMDFSDWKKGRVFNQSIISRSEGADELLDKRYSFKLIDAISEKSASELEKAGKLFPVLIKAPYYRISMQFDEKPKSKQFDLHGYGMLAYVTKKGSLVPVYRSSHGKEKWIFIDKEERSSINKDNWPSHRFVKRWPIIKAF